MGNNLLDALALGAGVLYALCAKQLMPERRAGENCLTTSADKLTEVLRQFEKNVLSVFAMKM